MIVTSQWKGFPDFSKNDSANFNMEASEKKTTQYVSFPTEFVWAKTNTKREQRSSPCLTHKATLNSPWWPGFAEVSRSYWAPRVRVFCMSLVTRGACMGKPWVELENTWRPCRGPVGVFFWPLVAGRHVSNSINWGSPIPFFVGWVGSRYENHWKSLDILKQIWWVIMFPFIFMLCYSGFRWFLIVLRHFSTSGMSWWQKLFIRIRLLGLAIHPKVRSLLEDFRGDGYVVSPQALFRETRWRVAVEAATGFSSWMNWNVSFASTCLWFVCFEFWIE